MVTSTCNSSVWESEVRGLIALSSRSAWAIQWSLGYLETVRIYLKKKKKVHNQNYSWKKLNLFPKYSTYSVYFYFFFSFWDRVSVCDPDWPPSRSSGDSAGIKVYTYYNSCLIFYKHHLYPTTFPKGYQNKNCANFTIPVYLKFAQLKWIYDVAITVNIIFHMQ